MALSMRKADASAKGTHAQCNYRSILTFYGVETTKSRGRTDVHKRTILRFEVKTMDPDRIAEEIRTKMIRQSLIEPEISSQAAPGSRKRRTMLDYQRRLKDTKLKIVATDGMIRKVRAGEIDLKHLKKEVIGSKDKNRRSRREFIKKLELLASLTQPENSENELIIFPDDFGATDDQKAILLLNKKKRSETLRKEARLLMEVIFGKHITREHIDLLQREYQKSKPDRANTI